MRSPVTLLLTFAGFVICAGLAGCGPSDGCGTLGGNCCSSLTGRNPCNAPYQCVDRMSVDPSADAAVQDR